VTRAELIERILFAVDGYRFGEWTLIDAGTRIAKLIEQNPT
jgi:ribosomal silencing factor RsfS